MSDFYYVPVVLALICLNNVQLSLSQIENSISLQLYTQFLSKYDKDYNNQTNEFWNRFHVFKESLKLSSKLNVVHENESEAVYGITKFSDLTPEEFKRMYLDDLRSPLLFSETKKSTPIENIRKLNIPQKVDWRSEQIISAIKNQGSCGACWAFSVVESVESMYSKESRVTVPDLAVQEVIDCSHSNDGCGGGDTCRALEWLQNGTPLVYQSAYPLKDKTQTCKTGIVEHNTHVNVFNYTCLHYVGNEDEMIRLLATVGPLTVTVDASTWNNYVGGIIQYHCSNFNNHAVQIVGYDLTGDVPYYIVRNSWGTDFGINGFLYIKIGENLCGIASRVSTVFVKEY